ncbi:hypothetical protein ACN20G_10030 [Streptomyces sp. BI20]|uniref:hypothetical protein n=1 Tax=Streptomyces sp. BI20 TaxID=3403460 RepID=UPI003C727071
MIRNFLGSLMGLVAAVAAVWSAFRPWYGRREGRDYRIAELFSSEGITLTDAGLFTSLFLPLAFAALVVLSAIVMRSRLLMVLAGVIVLGFSVLWMVRQGQAAGSLSVGGPTGTGLGVGVANAFGAGALLLLTGALMRGRRPAQRARTRAPGTYDLPPVTPLPDPPQTRGQGRTAPPPHDTPHDTPVERSAPTAPYPFPDPEPPRTDRGPDTTGR